MTASSLDRTFATASQPRAWIWPLVPSGIAVFGASSLVYYHMHPTAVSSPPSALQNLVIGTYAFFGFAPAFMLAVLVLSWSSVWWFTARIVRPGSRAVRVLAFTVALAVLINLRETQAQPHTGMLGWWIAERLVSLFGSTFSTIVMAPLALAALVLATDGFFYRYFEGMMRGEDDGLAGPALPPRRVETGVEPEATAHLQTLRTAVPPAVPGGAMPASASIGPAAAASIDDEPGAVVPPAQEHDWTPRRWARRDRGTTADEVGHAAPPRAATRDEPGAEATADVDSAGAVDPAARDELSTPDSSPTLLRRGRLAPLVDPGLELTEEPAAEASAAAPSGSAEPGDDRFADAAAGAGEGSAAVEPAEVVEAANAIEPADPVDLPVPSPEQPAPDPLAATTHAETGGLEPAEPVIWPGPQPEPHPESEADAGFELEPEPMPASGAGFEVMPEARSRAVDGSEVDAAPDGEPADDADAPGPLGEDGPPEGSDVPDASAREPVVAIPRPPEGVRQQRLFASAGDDQLVADAIDLVTTTRRASVTHLQRKLRIDYDQAVDLLATLARRGVIEIGEGETQGRVLV